MLLRFVIAALVAASWSLPGASPAEARHHYRHHVSYVTRCDLSGCWVVRRVTLWAARRHRASGRHLSPPQPPPSGESPAHQSSLRDHHERDHARYTVQEARKEAHDVPLSDNESLAPPEVVTAPVARLPELLGHSAAIVAVPTAAGIVIRVVASLADRFRGFIADIVAQGYRPRDISCYSPTGHMPGSRHHVGAACDIDQRARNRTHPFMYHVAAIAKAHGLRDGCSFRHGGPDCGHIDDGHDAGGRRYAQSHFHYKYRRWRRYAGW